MKNLIAFMFFFLICFGGIAQEGDDNFTIMSYNIRWNSPDDGVNVWDNRKEWLTESIEFFEGEIVGAQEVTHTQLQDMKDLLPNYESVGVGREGGTKGEYSPIFYNKERFEVLESDTFWLSENPEEVGSKSWDSSLPRIVTWARFEDKNTGKEFYFFNTHFDHRGEVARNKSAEIITEKIEEIVGDEPVILTGDLNTAPDSEPYNILLDQEMEDTYSNLDESQIYTPGYTFNSWDIEAKGDRHRIDYVFYKGEELSPVKYHVLDGQRGKRFISDHFPVIVEFKWDNN